MKLKYFICLLIASILLTLVFSWNVREKEKTPYQEYIGYVNEIKEAFGREMFKEFHLVPQGDFGQMHEKVEVMGMKFLAHRRATIEEARALQLFVMDRFVKAINAHEKIQPFLEERPFTYKRIQVGISFSGLNGLYSDGTVERISSVHDLAGAEENRNCLFYDAYDPFNCDSVEIHRESYDEALKLVSANRDVNPYVHHTTPKEEAFDQMVFSLKKAMMKKYQLESLSIGGKIDPTIEEVSVKFRMVKRNTQEEARKILLKVADEFIQTVNNDEQIRNYLAEFPFPTSRLKIRISFVKRDHFTYYDGSLESVTLNGDEVIYFQNSPPDSLTWPVETPVFAKESYQEAVRLSKS